MPDALVRRPRDFVAPDRERCEHGASPARLILENLADLFQREPQSLSLLDESELVDGGGGVMPIPGFGACGCSQRGRALRNTGWWQGVISESLARSPMSIIRLDTFKRPLGSRGPLDPQAAADFTLRAMKRFSHIPNTVFSSGSVGLLSMRHLATALHWQCRAVSPRRGRTNSPLGTTMCAVLALRGFHPLPAQKRRHGAQDPGYRTR